jgi:hypothetical protein
MENLGEMVCACEMEIEDSGSRPAWAKKKKKINKIPSQK